MSQCTLRKTKFDDLHSPISIFFIKLQHLMWYWCKNWGRNMQVDQWSRIDIAETDSHIHGQLNYDNTQWRKGGLFDELCYYLYYNTEKHEN